MDDTISDPQLHSDTQALYEALSDLVRLYQFRDRDRICCHDVSVTQCYALESMVRCGPMGLNALAAELYLDKSTASRVVNALERKGYLRREGDPQDGRALILTLTPEGLRLHSQIEAEILCEERALLAQVPPAVRREMTLLLRRLVTVAADRAGVPSPKCCGMP